MKKVKSVDRNFGGGEVSETVRTRWDRCPRKSMLWLWIFLLAAPLVGCGRRSDRAGNTATQVEEFKNTLKDVSNREAAALAKADRDTQLPSRSIAIIGDGVAGAAAAVNLANEPRVYGAPSFWNDLQGIPEVWQTDLSKQFKDAKLADPLSFDPQYGGKRLATDAILAVSLKGLIEAKAAYLQTGPVAVASVASGDWKLVDADGHVEVVTEALIVATGLARPRRITDAIPDAGTDSVRRKLFIAGKIMTGDDYLALSNPSSGPKTIGILGAGGNSADCIIRAIADAHVDNVVVWGIVPSELASTKAYTDMVNHYGDKICRVPANVTSIGYKSGVIEINGTKTPSCIEEKSKLQKIMSPPDMVIESLGRYTGDPPVVVATAARNRSINYYPIIDDSALIAIRVSFEDSGPSPVKMKPMYLIGAAATWIPPGVKIGSNELANYQAALKKTVQVSNPDAGSENGPPGFAAAAFMGSRLARICFNQGHLNTTCQ